LGTVRFSSPSSLPVNLIHDLFLSPFPRLISGARSNHLNVVPVVDHQSGSTLSSYISLVKLHSRGAVLRASTSCTFQLFSPCPTSFTTITNSDAHRTAYAGSEVSATAIGTLKHSRRLLGPSSTSTSTLPGFGWLSAPPMACLPCASRCVPDAEERSALLPASASSSLAVPEVVSPCIIFTCIHLEFHYHFLRVSAISSVSTMDFYII
jgi:hypothetical protein